MKKNVYSLVLSENVIAAIDHAAYRQNTSRSALINQILAEYVSYTTPQMRIKQVFENVLSLLSESTLCLAETGESMMTLRSSLEYKYNPTVRYTVVMQDGGSALGELRVSLRTKSAALMLILMRFFQAFVSVEEGLIGGGEYHMEADRFCRVLRLRTNRTGPEGAWSASEIGGLIAKYIRLFDTAMKVYFRCAHDPMAAELAVRRLYSDYLRSVGEIL